MTNSATRFTTQHAMLDLSLTHPLIARSLRDPHEMHRTVMAAFRHWVPDGAPDPRAQMGVLYTYSANLKTNTLTLVVQSRVAGDWTALPQAACLAPPDTRDIDLHISTGQRHRFRVVVNPARYAPGRQRTRNQPSNAAPKQALEWFAARLQPPGHPDFDRWPRIGADADPTELTALTLPTLSSTSAHHGMTVNRSQITGHLTVTDPRKFTATLEQGLGRSRAHGCGLLLTQSAHDHQLTRA